MHGKNTSNDFVSDLVPSSLEALARYQRVLNELGALETGPGVVGIRIALPATSSGRSTKGNSHSHYRGQLLSVEDGMVEIRCTHGTWLVPPRCAVWLPPGIDHAANAKGVTRSWNLYLSPAASEGLPQKARVIAVSRLMHELVQRVVSWGRPEQFDTMQQHIFDVLLDEIRRLPQESMHLPMSTDRRIARILEANLDDLADHRTLEEWAQWGGMSVRSLSRLFQKEIDMSFAQWRQLARLMSAMERLVTGQSINEISDALGYSSPSNFIAMFRRHFGEPPARYIAQSGHPND